MPGPGPAFRTRSVFGGTNCTIRVQVPVPHLGSLGIISRGPTAPTLPARVEGTRDRGPLLRMEVPPGRSCVRASGIRTHVCMSPWAGPGTQRGRVPVPFSAGLASTDDPVKALGPLADCP